MAGDGLAQPGGFIIVNLVDLITIEGTLLVAPGKLDSRVRMMPESSGKNC